MSELDKKIPKLFKIMSILSNRGFIGNPKKNYFKSMTELYSNIGGKNGGTQPIIAFLRELKIIEKDDNGIYYNTIQAKKLIKHSQLIDLVKSHGLEFI